MLYKPQNLQKKIDFKTKPLGALGKLEEIAFQIGCIQQTLTPELNKPALVVFAGDHGIAQEGVSAYPQEVTFQMVQNFLNGGAAINVFSKQHGFNLQIVDAGVNFDFPTEAPLIQAKVGKGTRNFLNAPAMTLEQFEDCLFKGKQVVYDLEKQGTNIIGFGEMGIANTSASAMIMSYLLDLPLAECIGKGTGLDDKGLVKKLEVLAEAKRHHGSLSNPKQIGAAFCGFEMAQMCGAMIAAKEKNMILLVDGFIASSVFLLAHKFSSKIKDNALFCHLSEERGHKTLLEKLDVKPILNLDLRLGEGTGCTLAYPIIESAVRFLNEMASFESAGISDKE